jgi:regulatory subunit for Cdc7p protein kinase
MAAVSIPPSPHVLGAMTTRRVPLSNVPNAANSPFRAIQAAASKRSRAQVNALETNLYDEPPPAKKQIIEVEQPIPRTPPPRKQPQATEGRVFNKRPTDSQLTAFDRKLLAAKERTAPARVIKDEKVPDEQEMLRQWQRHYRRVFPDFVFYFESVPEDARRQYSRQLHAFGAVCLCHSSYWNLLT